MPGPNQISVNDLTSMMTGGAVYDPVSDPGNSLIGRFINQMLGSVVSTAKVPGQVMTPNPYNQSTDPEAWQMFEDSRSRAIAQGAPALASMVMGGSGVVPTRATLRAGLKPLFDPTELALANISDALDLEGPGGATRTYQKNAIVKNADVPQPGKITQAIVNKTYQQAAPLDLGPAPWEATPDAQLGEMMSKLLDKTPSPAGKLPIGNVDKQKALLDTLGAGDDLTASQAKKAVMGVLSKFNNSKVPTSIQQQAMDHIVDSIASGKASVYKHPNVDVENAVTDIYKWLNNNPSTPAKLLDLMSNPGSMKYDPSKTLKLGGGTKTIPISEAADDANIAAQLIGMALKTDKAKAVEARYGGKYVPKPGVDLPPTVAPSSMHPDVLPEAERQAQRLAAGYTEPAYRGMKIYPGKDIEPTHPGIHSQTSEGYNEMYSSASPKLADMYSDYMSVHPDSTDYFGEGASAVPLWINTKDYHRVDAQGKSWKQVNYGAISEAREKGAPGVVIDNVWDEPNSTKALGAPQRVFITLPSGAHTVKSKFAAKFDPTSSDMSYGVIPAIGLGAGSGVALAPSDHDAWSRVEKDEKGHYTLRGMPLGFKPEKSSP